jgi:pilus assembly protein CpaF
MTGFEVILPFLRPIEHLILDAEISEIMVNGSDRVFIERQGLLEAVPVTGLTHKSLLIAVKNIARRLGDDISESKPILDSRLPDGSRVAAVIPPLQRERDYPHPSQVQCPAFHHRRSRRDRDASTSSGF